MMNHLINRIIPGGLLGLMGVCSLQAQTLFSPDGGMDHFQKTQRLVLDNAKIDVLYRLKYLEDSTKIQDYTEAQTVLRLSDHYALYTEYYKIALDSINDLCAESKKNARRYRTDWEEACKKCCLVMNFRSAINLEKAVATVQRRGIRNYQYEQSLPNFKWNLVEGDTLILDKPCKKAIGSYAGRDYVAWYAESVNMPYGPYLFGGLPGLIMYLHDTHYNWVFTCNGIEKATKLRSMYLYKNKDIIQTTREKALTACKNEEENFMNLAIDEWGIEVNGKKPEANYPQSPCNMLELQW